MTAKKLIAQVVIFTPVFWMVELIQNAAYKQLFGDYGWT